MKFLLTFLLAFVPFGIVAGLFIWSASKDAATWTNPWDRLTHPYSMRSKVLCILFIFGGIPWVAIVGSAG